MHQSLIFQSSLHQSHEIANPHTRELMQEEQLDCLGLTCNEWIE